MLPKTRLGKRSPLGALLNATCITGDPGVTVATEHPAVGRVKGHPGLKFLRPAEDPSPSCIDVPRSQRSPEQVDVDELMAAMVLSSLSCSMNSPPEPEVLQMDCGGDLSDSSSGYWSVGLTNGSPTPSPPITGPDAGQAPPPDEGLDMERETVLFDEPAPRKRKNSVKVAYRCLWPSCGKVLTSVVGIKRHIRTTHLSRGSDHERCSRSEEDFYYTPSGSAHQLPRQAPPVSHVTSSVAPPTSCLRQSCDVISGSAHQLPPQGLAFRVRSVSVGEQWAAERPLQ
ncbi:hypothetical protein KUCAC02_033900, partial [Chaenocephalus aceratus]